MTTKLGLQNFGRVSNGPFMRNIFFAASDVGINRRLYSLRLSSSLFFFFFLKSSFFGLLSCDLAYSLVICLFFGGIIIYGTSSLHTQESHAWPLIYLLVRSCANGRVWNPVVISILL